MALTNRESLFSDNECHPLPQLLPQSLTPVRSKNVERYREMLEVTQETESEFFWQEAAASNLLAFLYWISKENDKALKQLRSTTERYPNNLNAIEGIIKILKEQNNCSEAKKKQDQYKRLMEDNKELEKQKGEIAYACSVLGPEFYVQAIDRYEALLHPDSKIWTMKDELGGYIIRWKYHLAYTYNRMLNKGHREKLTEKLGTNDIDVIFHKISQLYDAIISSDDEFHKGKAMIDLVDTHKKCETSGKYQKIEFPYKCSPEEFVKEAMEIAPKDPHVLERCARHYRQKAYNKAGFESTVEIFDRLLKLHPTRHMAWHHKGLTYRALWHIVGKYDEAELYTNSARKGQKKRIRKHKPAHSQASRIDAASSSTPAASAAECYPDRSYQGDADEPRGLQNVSGDKPPTDTLKHLSISRETLHNAPSELPTLPSWQRKCQDMGDVPRPTKKPDFFDNLRTRNLPVKDNRSRTFLVQAKECFEKAKEISKGMCSPYIVDLARCLVSLGLHDEAEQEFVKAECNLSSTLNNNDATYLYEQWALLRHSRAEKSADADDGTILDAACLYRKAILSAVRARERSRIAFYNLRDLLDELLQHDPGNTALKLEHNVLYNSVEKYSECGEMSLLVEALKNDEETTEVAWQMIELLRCRRHNAATAFTYLTALREANQLNFNDSPAATPAGKLTHKQLVFDVAGQLVSERDQTSGQALGEVFRWIVGSRHISDYIRVDPSTPRPFSSSSSSSSSEICILAPSDSAPGTETVVRLLQDVCSIAVVKAFCEGNCDVRWGVPVSEGLRSVAAAAQSVVVVEDSTDAENWSRLSPVLEELLPITVVKVCFVADEDTDCRNTEQRYLARWPRFTVGRNSAARDDIELAHSLLEELLGLIGK